MYSTNDDYYSHSSDHLPSSLLPIPNYDIANYKCNKCYIIKHSCFTIIHFSNPPIVGDGYGISYLVEDYKISATNSSSGRYGKYLFRNTLRERRITGTVKWKKSWRYKTAVKIRGESVGVWAVKAAGPAFAVARA